MVGERVTKSGRANGRCLSKICRSAEKSVAHLFKIRKLGPNSARKKPGLVFKTITDDNAAGAASIFLLPPSLGSVRRFKLTA